MGKRGVKEDGAVAMNNKERAIKSAFFISLRLR